jgi:hypothetical protein
MTTTVEPWNVRSKLGLSADTLARLLGVYPSVIEGWDHSRHGLRKDNAEWIGQLEAAADAARDPLALGRAITRATWKHGRFAGLYLALHTLNWRLAPRKVAHAKG